MFKISLLLIAGITLASTPFRSYAQCNPAIPSTAKVVTANQATSGVVWICTGAVDSTNGNLGTFFLEPGAFLNGKNGIRNKVFAPKGATVMYITAAYADTIYYVDSTDIVLVASPSAVKIKCSSIVYDYTNAPTTGCIHTTAIATIAEPTFEIYPNPSRGNIRISFPESARKGEMSVYSSMGEEIYSREINSNDIVLTGLKPGVYFLHVLTGVDSMGSLIKRIIVVE